MSISKMKGKIVENHVEKLGKSRNRKWKTSKNSTSKLHGGDKDFLKKIIEADGKNLTSKEVETRVRFLFRDIGCFEAEVDMTLWYAKVYRAIGEKKAYFISKDCRKDGVHSPTKLLHYLLKKAWRATQI